VPAYDPRSHYCRPPDNPDQKRWKCGVCGATYGRGNVGRFLGKWLMRTDPKR
jgi:hypothetical protein